MWRLSFGTRHLLIVRLLMIVFGATLILCLLWRFHFSSKPVEDPPIPILDAREIYVIKQLRAPVPSLEEGRGAHEVREKAVIEEYVEAFNALDIRPATSIYQRDTVAHFANPQVQHRVLLVDGSVYGIGFLINGRITNGYVPLLEGQMSVQINGYLYTTEGSYSVLSNIMSTHGDRIHHTQFWNRF